MHDVYEKDLGRRFETFHLRLKDGRLMQNACQFLEEIGLKRKSSRTNRKNPFCYTALEPVFLGLV